MNITHYKDGNKSVKTLSLNELIDTMRDSVKARGISSGILLSGSNETSSDRFRCRIEKEK